MTKLYLGALSGTSMDAVDIAAVCFEAQQPVIHATFSAALPEAYKNAYLSIINAGSCELNSLGELDQWTAELFAAAILECIATNNLDKHNIAAIGSHGQTLWHAPLAKRPFSLQLGDPNVIAYKTGITTVTDFRRADIAAGGQGAPLAPIFHKAVFSSDSEARCIVNIGGFSNVSILENSKHMGFDCGPGNCLLDYWVRTHFDLAFDAAGALAASGSVHQELLADMLSDAYFKLAAPKSTGREYFNAAWLQSKILSYNNILPVDVLATLLHLTAYSISDAIKRYAIPNTKVYVCGGGAKNTALCTQLSKNLEQTIETTVVLGIDPGWVEAALFAWLAKQQLGGVYAY